MKTLLVFLAMVVVAQCEEVRGNDKGAELMKEVTLGLASTIKDIDFSKNRDEFMLQICDLYRNFIQYIETYSARFESDTLNVLRTVARVGGYYHRLSGRCPLLEEDKTGIDSEHAYTVTQNDKDSCGDNLRADDYCVFDWVDGIKDGTNTCSIFRSGIQCHMIHHEKHCLNRVEPSELSKAFNHLQEAFKLLENMTPEAEVCIAMTP